MRRLQHGRLPRSAHPLFDSAAQTWSDELLQAMALDRAKLPPLVGCMDIVGHATAAAAQATGPRPAHRSWAA
ncbi:MAG: hypothetical protein R2851_06560 [Caldilineaceae bacterium]